jgi:hypothetical protein
LPFFNGVKSLSLGVSWKVGVKKGANPKKGKKITVDKAGKIVKIYKQ